MAKNAQTVAARELLAKGLVDEAVLRTQLAEIAERRRGIEQELEASRAREQRVRNLEGLRDALQERSRIWGQLYEECPELEEYVIGPPPWANDPFARFLVGDLQGATPEKRCIAYRDLDLRVTARPEGGIMLTGVFGEKWLCINANTSS